MWGLIPAYIIQQDDQVPMEPSTLFITDSSSDLILAKQTNKQTKEIYILNCIAKRKTQVVEYATSAVKIGFKSTNRFTFIVVKPVQSQVNK